MDWIKQIVPMELKCFFVCGKLYKPKNNLSVNYKCGWIGKEVKVDEQKYSFPKGMQFYGWVFSYKDSTPTVLGK